VGVGHIRNIRDCVLDRGYRHWQCSRNAMVGIKFDNIGSAMHHISVGYG
jgi:hypothetical protein